MILGEEKSERSIILPLMDITDEVKNIHFVKKQIICGKTTCINKDIVKTIRIFASDKVFIILFQ